MKTLFSSLIILCLFVLTSCATDNIGQHYKFLEPNADVKSDIGFLKIYTLNYKEKGDCADDPVYNIYKGYTIYTPEGEYVMDVKKAYNKPELVKLKTGEYIVIAELHKNVLNSFTIEIEKGKILEINESMIKNPYADLRSSN